MRLTIDEFEKIKTDGRLIVMNAALDSTCYFLTPDCNKCTRAVYKSGSKKCMYNLKKERCYIRENTLIFEDGKSLGRPEYWQVNEMTLTIYYNKLFSGKFGRIIFTEKEKAMKMASKFNSLVNDGVAIGDFENIPSYNDYVKLERQNRIVILPCKVGEKYYVAKPDCSECKYKNDGYKGCGYIPKKGESPYSCTYETELDACRVFNQSCGDIIYIEPERYSIEEIHFTEYGLLSYDIDRRSSYGVWTERNTLIEMLEKLKNKSCV